MFTLFQRINIMKVIRCLIMILIVIIIITVIMWNSYKPPFYGGFLLFFLLDSFTSLSSSSSDSSALNLHNYQYTYPTNPSPEDSTIQSTEKIISAIGTTAFLVAGAFFLCLPCFRPQPREEIGSGGGESNQTRSLTAAKVEAGNRSEVVMLHAEIKELIVDEEGLDVFYWKKLKNFNGSIHEKPQVRVSYRNGDWKTPTVLHGRSSPYHSQLLPEHRSEGRNSGFSFQFAANSGGGLSSSTLTASASSSPAVPYGGSSSSYGQMLPNQRPDGQNNGFGFQFAANAAGGVGGALYSTEISTASESSSMAVPNGRSSFPYGQMLPGQQSDGRSSGFSLQFAPNSGGGVVGLPSSSAILTAPTLSSTAVSSVPTPAPPAPPAPAPPPPPPPKIAPIPPPPPPAPVKKAPMAPPPPPPKLGSGKKPSAPKPPSRGGKTPEALAKDIGSESGKDQVMLKPLHWEKLNVDPEHSMVWNKIERGSFQYTDDKMEALFGFVPTNRKSEDNPNSKATDPNAKIFILDPRKSRNTAIVLKSLGIPRSELIDSLLEGTGLSIETLEKLARTVPTREEESEILAFDGDDPAKLADAESFLYSLLKAVPLAFTRANAMLFRLNYGSEILNVKESLQVMEPACNELKSHGIFLKLLEAILKAGNRLNAGTARGGAKAFNLTTLLKLSDFKSSDGKTTLLSFVVHEVVRNEGRRITLTQKNDTTSKNDNDPVEKEEKEKELLLLGLPVVSSLSSEFLNVKKAASIDYDALKSALASLKNRFDETNQIVSKCKSSSGTGGFVKEMEDFLKSAETELKAIQDEHTRVMQLVTKTTQYYQAGASNDKNPLQLFIIVKDFLGMVDQTCAQIARSSQPKKPVAATGPTVGPSSTQQDHMRTRVIFPGLKEHFLLANKTIDNSSDSDDDF